MLLETLARLPASSSPTARPSNEREDESGADWSELASWYDEHGRSGPEQLRTAANQALTQLITNAKRLLDSSGTCFSRRAHFLRLARWFNAANNEDAHRLYAATFAAYPARHLLFGPDEPDPRIGPTTRGGTPSRSGCRCRCASAASSLRGKTSRVPTRPPTGGG